MKAQIYEMKSEFDNATKTYEEGLRNCTDINSCVKLRMEMRAIPAKIHLGVAIKELMSKTPEVSF